MVGNYKLHFQSNSTTIKIRIVYSSPKLCENHRFRGRKRENQATMDKIESRLSEMSIANNDVQSVDRKWGWPLKDLYRLALSFYKGGKCSGTRFAPTNN